MHSQYSSVRQFGQTMLSKGLDQGVKYRFDKVRVLLYQANLVSNTAAEGYYAIGFSA